MWVRAITLAVSPDKSNIQAVRSLTTHEERLCNRVAGRLLVPEDLLIQETEQRIGNLRERGIIDIDRLVRQLSDAFAVSGECVLVQLQRAIQAGTISFGPEFCMFWVGESSTSGSGQQTSRKRRALISVLPDTVGTLQIGRIFPGLSTENFGVEFDSFVRSIFDKLGQIRSGEVRTTLLLRPRDRDRSTRPREFELRGWWRIRGGVGSEKPPRMLMWGRLSA